MPMEPLEHPSQNSISSPAVIDHSLDHLQPLAQIGLEKVNTIDLEHSMPQLPSLHALTSPNY